MDGVNEVDRRREAASTLDIPSGLPVFRDNKTGEIFKQPYDLEAPPSRHEIERTVALRTTHRKAITDTHSVSPNRSPANTNNPSAHSLDPALQPDQGSKSSNDSADIGVIQFDSTDEDDAGLMSDTLITPQPKDSLMRMKSGHSPLNEVMQERSAFRFEDEVHGQEQRQHEGIDSEHSTPISRGKYDVDPPPTKYLRDETTVHNRDTDLSSVKALSAQMKPKHQLNHSKITASSASSTSASTSSMNTPSPSGFAGHSNTVSNSTSSSSMTIPSPGNVSSVASSREIQHTAPRLRTNASEDSIASVASPKANDAQVTGTMVPVRKMRTLDNLHVMNMNLNLGTNTNLNANIVDRNRVRKRKQKEEEVLSDGDVQESEDGHRSRSPSASPIARRYTQEMGKFVPRISAKDVESMEISKQIESFRESHSPSQEDTSSRGHSANKKQESKDRQSPRQSGRESDGDEIGSPDSHYSHSPSPSTALSCSASPSMHSGHSLISPRGTSHPKQAPNGQQMVIQHVAQHPQSQQVQPPNAQFNRYGSHHVVAAPVPLSSHGHQYSYSLTDAPTFSGVAQPLGVQVQKDQAQQHPYTQQQQQHYYHRNHQKSHGSSASHGALDFPVNAAMLTQQNAQNNVSPRPFQQQQQGTASYQQPRQFYSQQ